MRRFDGDGPAVTAIAGPGACEEAGIAVDGDPSVARVGSPAGLLTNDGALLICGAASNGLRRMVAWAGPTACVETLLGRTTLGGGLPLRVDVALEDVVLEFVAAGAVAQERLWFAVEDGVYPVDLGDAGAGESPDEPTPNRPRSPSAFIVDVGVGQN